MNQILVGTGHLLRMNILSQHLKKSAKVSFLTRTQENFDVSKKILSSENIIKLTNDSLIYPNSTNEIKTIIKHKPNLVIFDRLNTSIQLINVLKKKKNKLKVISFDDLGLGSTLTDITIISLFKTKYKKKIFTVVTNI